MRRLPAYGAFNLVCCLDDAVNYLLEESDLVEAFRSAARNLAPTGVYVFDVNTLLTYRTFFASDVLLEADDRLLAWRGRGREDVRAGAWVEATFDAFEPRADGAWTRTTSPHLQRHYPEAVVRESLAEGGLDCLGVFGHGPDGRAEPGLDEDRHTKGVFIARRRAPARGRG
jgi:hypothetical protein